MFKEIQIPAGAEEGEKIAVVKFFHESSLITLLKTPQFNRKMENTNNLYMELLNTFTDSFAFDHLRAD